MARNIEIKAQIESVEALAARAAAIAGAGPIEMDQDDTFFRCESGRLKLRALSNESTSQRFWRGSLQAPSCAAGEPRRSAKEQGGLRVLVR